MSRARLVPFLRRQHVPTDPPHVDIMCSCCHRVWRYWAPDTLAEVHAFVEEWPCEVCGRRLVAETDEETAHGLRWRVWARMLDQQYAANAMASRFKW
jgi:hypothetical protein